MPLIYSCTEEAPLSSAELAAANQSRIIMDMDEDLLLTISISNVIEPLSFLGFTLVYNDNVLSISNVSEGEYNIPFSTDDYSTNDEYLSLIFSGITGTGGELIKIKFTGASYKETSIFIEDLLLIDADKNEIYPEWSIYTRYPICFISKVPSDVENIGGQDLFNEGEYGWYNNYCEDWRN